MKKVTIWWFSLAILIVILLGGGYFIQLSSNLNEYIEGNVYFLEFHLMTQDFNDENQTIHLQNFCVFYDFTKNKGNISFHLYRKNWSLSYINVDFPSSIQDENIYLYSIKNGIKTDIEAKIIIHEDYSNIMGNDYSNISISDFNRTFYDEKFVIEFESDLQPSGSFFFIYNNKYNNLMADYKLGNVNFVLGDDYECIDGCVQDLEYIEEIKYSSDRNLKLKFIDEEDPHNKGFKLNAVNRKIRQWKTIFLGLGISLIVASLNSIFILLYNDGNENDFSYLKMGFKKMKNIFYKIKNRIYILFKDLITNL